MEFEPKPSVPSAFVTLNGVNLAVRRNGQMGSMPVVLLHGLSSHGAIYDNVVNVLESNYDVHRLDFRGHGRSSRHPGTYDVNHHVSDIVAYLEAEVGQPAFLVGHSLGGVVAHLIAQRLPELVLGLFEEDPPLFFCDIKLFQSSVFARVFPILESETRILQEQKYSLETAYEFIANSPSPRGGIARDWTLPSDLAARAQSLILVDPEVWPPAIDGRTLLGYEPETPVKVPLTVLRSDPTLGAALLPEHSDRLQTANPHADIICVIGASHDIHGEVPTSAEYLALLQKTLASASALLTDQMRLAIESDI
jgi:pimeloyl-ACP methyl ester carboxylesterase